MADNYRLDLVHDSMDVLKDAIKMAFKMDEREVAIGWIIKSGWLVIMTYEHDPDKKPVNRFLAPAESDSVFQQCKDWLEEQDYGLYPDHDGGSKKGFRISTASCPIGIEYDKEKQSADEYGTEVGLWNQPRGDVSAIFAIRPQYTWYGK